MRVFALFVSLLALLPPPPVSLAVAAPARARGADARHCLDLGDIRQIARCAEPYRRPARMSGRDDPGATAAPVAPAAAPAAARATEPAAAKPARRAATGPSPRAERRRRGRDVDARHCLDLADYRAIAHCAERYR